MTPGKGPRQKLRRELRVDLERVEVDERQSDVRRERLHERTLVERHPRVPGKREAEPGEDLCGVDPIVGSVAPLARARSALSEESRVNGGCSRQGVANLVLCQKASSFGDVAEKLES